MKFPDILRRPAVVTFMVISVAVVCAFLYLSSLLVGDLAEQERMRMQTWADATRELANLSTDDAADATHIDFLLSIIEGNTNIPVLLTDDSGNIVMHRNFRLPEPVDSLAPFELSEANLAFLQQKLEHLRNTTRKIDITLEPGSAQHLYYEDSRLLRNLSYFPYILLAVMAAFVLVVYFAVTSSLRAEQNKVWVGLSKETAHQLGTPISSLMAWTQLLESQGVDSDIVSEMDKDVKRLSTIASRFSKIGSRPSMEPADLNEVVSRSAAYMSNRISRRVNLTTDLCAATLTVSMSEPLVEWVMENLIKNAVDAMEGAGSLHIALSSHENLAVVEVTDSGKGIPRKYQAQVFKPGYTTKKRGWGLGLALARRIINQYHSGRIYVKWSEPGRGTTFRIELPLASETTSVS